MKISNNLAISNNYNTRQKNKSASQNYNNCVQNNVSTNELNKDTICFLGKTPKTFSYQDYRELFPELYFKWGGVGKLVKNIKIFTQKFGINAKLYDIYDRDLLSGRTIHKEDVEKRELIHLLSTEDCASDLIDAAVDSGANINAKTANFNFTPLYLATCGKLEKNAKTIIKNGGDAGITCNLEHPMLNFLINKPTVLLENFNSMYTIPNPEYTKLLLESGVKNTINIADTNKNTALHLISMPYDYDTIHEMFSIPKAQSIAAQNANIKLLLDAGADKTIVNNEHRTAESYWKDIK